jgi:hypothetical protein
MTNRELCDSSVDEGLGQFDMIPLMQIPETTVTDTSWLNIEGGNNAARNEGPVSTDQ